MNSLLNNNPMIGVINWFKKAKPEPTTKGINAQLGVHFEEVSEMLAELGGVDVETETLITGAHVALVQLADRLKKAGDTEMVRIPNRQNYLDSLCDQVVTAIGCAHDAKVDIYGGLDVVNQSNWSKFDHNGDPIFAEGGKIMKGPNYVKADLSHLI